ncbi:hypothetical protein [Acetomicrobium mobile]|uniref:hypothetical protein n=1 Tax=Acetomicrobium mobile TaxID=97477 RepID=UPI0026EBDB2E|nr:hypothetical protein [Acetomicrobium mobile]
MIGKRRNARVEEFGDYQTPDYFVDKVCQYVKNELKLDPDIILEPTFGLGSFIIGSIKAFENLKSIFGIEINKRYFDITKRRIYEIVKDRSIKIQLYNEDIFVFDFDDIKNYINKNDKLLIIGNPPWVTNSDLGSIDSRNIPLKSNFKGLNGFDAITGKSNFDIAEYILLHLLHEFKNYNYTIAMLCKSVVARNILKDLKRSNIKISDLRFLSFNTEDIFGISCEAGLLIMKSGNNSRLICNVYDFDNPIDIKKSFGWVGEYFISDIENYMQSANIDGKCQYEWRQGIKHDCSKVMELSTKQPDGTYINGMGDRIIIEDDYVYPLLKSSDIKNVIITSTRKNIIVTQKEIKEETNSIKDISPKLWLYLQQHSALLDGRKSSIYKNAPRFSIFGIGDYSFKPYKVVISGFYKNPLFALVYSKHGRPIMLDDTCYFLGFDNFKEALIVMLILNSNIVQKFIKSIAFLGSKRPYTKEILMRIDILKASKNITFDELVALAMKLHIEYPFTREDYNNIIRQLSMKSAL